MIGNVRSRRHRGEVQVSLSHLPLVVVLALGMAGCTTSARKDALPSPEDVAPAPYAGVEAGMEAPAPDSTVSEPGMEFLYPELLSLDESYRATLEAIRDDDLPAAEEALAQLDEELSEAQRDVGPPASFYVESMASRVKRLQGLVDEMRQFQSYLDRMGADGDFVADTAADSLALAQLHAHIEPIGPKGPRHDLELVENALVERWIRYFTGDGRHYMELWLSRQPLYEDTIDRILDEHDLPRDLIYLAMIESGLSLKARSYANAVGPWQFISSTGRLYGLKIDWWVDERRHLEKATEAAASHLSDLYESLGSWPLAMAAYNCGIRRVERAIRRHGTRDFWQLRSLPRQTRNYVPKFMAALEIGHNRESYGFAPAESEPLAYDVIQVDDATDLHLVADLAHTSLDVLVELNPHLKRWSTPPGAAYEIRVPAGTGDSVGARLAQVAPEDRVRWRRHRVSRGESLGLIARQYGTSVTAIRQANNMRGTMIHPGEHLLIPVVGGTPGTLAQQSIEHAAKVNKAESTTYVVRRGDTLGRISSRYGVSVRQLMEWNDKSSTRIRVGERLELFGTSGPRQITYVVQRGDTLSTISKRHRVSVHDLMSWNKKHNTRIRVGERLRIFVNG